MPDKEKTERERGISRPADQDPERPRGRSWLFGIGIDNYRHFNPLLNAVRDVTAFLTLMQKNYEVDEVLTLFNEEATRRNIIRKLDELTKQVDPGDKLLLLYSGHGHLSSHGKGYWIPHDAERNYTDDYISNSRLRDFLEDIPAKHTLLISDACFSGSLFSQGGTRRLPEPEEVLEGRISRYAFCSGRHDEAVHDGKPDGHSPFMNSILEVLGENQAARLRISLLAERVMGLTASQYRQLPQHGPLFAVGDKGGQYIFRLRRSEENIWEACRTIADYNHYLQQYPNGAYAGEALRRIRDIEDDREWAKAGQINRVFAYQRYLQIFRNGRYADAARERIRDLEKRSAPPTYEYVIPNAPPPPATFTDLRDGQVYRTADINGLTWMAQNLNFDAGAGCGLYHDDTGQAADYGRLYTWEAAARACPPGWRLPTLEEWRALARHFGGYYDWQAEKNIADPVRAYRELQNSSFNFDSLLAGRRHPDGSFFARGVFGALWSSTPYGREGAGVLTISRKREELGVGFNPKNRRYACRYVKE